MTLYISKGTERYESGSTYANNAGDGEYSYVLGTKALVLTKKFIDSSGSPTGYQRWALEGSFSFANDGRLTGGNIEQFSWFDYIGKWQIESGQSFYIKPEFQDLAKWSLFGGFTASAEEIAAAASSVIYLYNSSASDIAPYKSFPALKQSLDRQATVEQFSNSLAPYGWWNEPFSLQSQSSINTGSTVASGNLSGTAKKADLLTFADTPSFGRESADRITNFNPKEKDKLQIQLSQFGPDAAGKFRVAKNAKALTKALASTTDFIYLKSSGELYYNENAATAGFGNGGVFAVIEGHPTIKAANIGFI